MTRKETRKGCEKVQILKRYSKLRRKNGLHVKKYVVPVEEPIIFIKFVCNVKEREKAWEPESRWHSVFLPRSVQQWNLRVDWKLISKLTLARPWCDVEGYQGNKIYERNDANQSSSQDLQCRESLWPHGKCKVQLVNPVDRKMNVVSIWLGVDAINYNSEWKDQDFVPRSNWTCVHRESEREPNKLPNFRWIGIALSSGMCCLFDGLGSLATPLQLEVDKDDPFSSHWDEFLKLWENHWKSTLMILKLRLS